MIDDQLCWSAADRLTKDSSNANQGWVHYEIAPACPNGVTSNLTSASAAKNAA